MTKLLLTLICVAAMSVSFELRQRILDVDQVNKALSAAVIVHNKSYTMDEENATIKKHMVGCSGTFIASNTVLTAAHCFSDASMGLWVKDSLGKVYEAKLIKIDATKDLALLGVVNKAPHKYAKLAKTVRVGEGVVNVGSPYGIGLTISEGIIAMDNYQTKPFKGTFLITTGMINSGSSGGAALNEAGEIVGVNTMTMGGFFGWAGISIAVDLKTIKTFLGGKTHGT